MGFTFQRSLPAKCGAIEPVHFVKLRTCTRMFVCVCMCVCVCVHALLDVNVLHLFVEFLREEGRGK